MKAIRNPIEFKQISFYLYREQYKQIENIARLRGVPKSLMYREMAALLIKKYDPLVQADAQKTLLRKK